ncbi:MAG: MlaD family protein [Isosphaeraceae bacterium]|nr:MlaD family protein [Isosphaeraceae bacterium]
MNERVMQFRIGMFVIVAGLVLTMMIIWFGESPSLLRDHVYLKARFAEAPGVAEGTPVRKSGIRIGQVSAIEFDERPNQPEGVIVTLSLEAKYKIREGATPKVSRSLIGDVAIDMEPGTGTGHVATSRDPAHAPMVEGSVAPDPAKALAAATQAFEKAGDTLKTIDEAFVGLSKITKNADQVGPFLTTWSDTGKRVSAAADKINGFIANNETDFKPAVTNLKAVSEKLNATLDPETQKALKRGLGQFAAASERLNTSLTDAAPLFKDLGAPVDAQPKTDFGQTVRRLNVITSDINLLTSTLRTKEGRLNPNGTLQRLMAKSEIYDNLNHMVIAANETFGGLKPVVAALRVFAEKVSRDPSALTRGALQR